MSANELTMRMRLDRSHARQALKEHTDDLDRVRGKAKEAGDEQDKGVAGSATRGAAAFRGLKSAAGEAFGGISAGTVAAGVGMGKLLSIVQGLNGALKDAGEKTRQMSKNFNDDRDKLRELAGIMGVKNDSAFALDNAKFNVMGMMNAREGLAFRTQFQNSGAQYAGKTMSGAQFADFEKLGAKLTVAKGLEADVAGDFFGSVAGLKDYSKSKNPAAEALGVANSAISVLGRGKGANAQLVKQLSMVNSALLNEDDFKGVIQDPNEAAALVSIAAEYNPEEAATMTKAAARGLRDFKGKPAALLSEAKIGAKDTPMQAIRKLAPVVLDRARIMGVKPGDILRENFEDLTSVAGLDVFINKGFTGGGFDDRMSFAAKNAGADGAVDAINEFAGSESGAKRIADAQIELARAGRGAENSKLDVLRREALGQLIAEKQIDSSAASVRSFLGGLLPFGELGSDSATIDTRVSKLLHDRAPRQDLWVNQKMGPGEYGATSNIESRNAGLNRMVEAVEGAGGNVFVDALNANSKLLQENNELMRRAAGGNVPPPMQPAPPVPRRP